MKVLTVPQSGSLAGQTASRNRFGQYLRSRAVPVNPNSARQTAVRAVLSGCSANWATLDDAERASWAAWAALHPRNDSLGSVIVMTGAQAFNAVNCLLVGVGLSAVSVPPNDPLPDPPAISIDPDSWTVDGGAWDGAPIGYTPTPVPAATNILFYGSPPKSVGTGFNRDYRYLYRRPAAGASPADLNTFLGLKWGAPAIGQKFFIRARIIRTDGGTSAWSNIATTVTVSV